MQMESEDWELRRFGHWSAEAQSMCLPSYKSAFLFLARIALDLIHEYLRLRLEQKPSEPSALSIRQVRHINKTTNLQLIIGHIANA
jgi:mitogen-activated protein kinase kinase kinase 4